MQRDAFWQIASSNSPWVNNPERFHREADHPTRRLTELLWNQLNSAPITERACHKIVLGPRRVGKTTLLKHIARNAVETQLYSPEKVLYLSLEDYAFNKASLNEILDLATKTLNATQEAPALLLLDEIVHSQGWDRTLKRCYDEPGLYPFRIVGTSSSASGLRQGMRESIAGRAEYYYLLPAQMSESLKLGGISVPAAEEHAALGEIPLTESIRHIAQGAKALEPLVWCLAVTGGCPENINYQDSGDNLEMFIHGRQEKVRELVDQILRKDMKEHANISSYAKLDAMFRKQADNPGSQVVMSDWARDPEIAVTRPTLSKYWLAFDEAMLSFLLPNKAGRLKSPKVYFYDNFIPSAMSYHTPEYLLSTEHKGWLLENLVAASLNEIVKHTREAASLHHLRDSAQREFDFIFKDHISKEQLALEIGSRYANKRKKLSRQKALLAKDGFSDLRENAYLITPDAPAEQQGDIKSVPLAEFLLLVEARKNYLLSQRTLVP